tara:strand:- start:3394 stop:4086 length:693 start_codon:yes stop_codon:yes gene_type:complete
MDQLTEYIKNSLIESENARREYQIFDDIFVFVKDHLPEHVSLINVLSSIERIIPHHLAQEVDGMYIGQFKEWGDREVNSMFKDASIFVTNEQDDDEDMIDDIVHEFAHSIEGPMGDIIYSDGALQQEFIGKRKRLYFLVKAEGYDVSSEKFMNSEYEEKFDDFLYKKIGYDALSSIGMGLFITPYAATSLREYFATGYTEYLMGDKSYLMKVSPELYKKMVQLTGETDEN